MISVLLIDPCDFVRAGVRTILAKTTDIRLIENASTGMTALAEVAQRQPTVILTETSLREDTGNTFRHAIRQSSPASRILFFSGLIDPLAIRATALGETAGYLLKDADVDEMIRAIRTVAEGHTYLDPRLAEQILVTLRESGGPGGAKALSAQEEKVIAYLAEGKTNKEIAVLLELSDKTVKNYLAHAYEKLQVHRRSQAASWYVRHCGRGVCPPNPPSSGKDESGIRCSFQD